MIRKSSVPSDSLLGRYAASGAYADCYVTEVPGPVSQARFVEAFYTTPLFRIERWLLRLLLSRPSTDLQAQELATGQRTTFAAWSVESRTASELVLAAGRTRSWLMVEPVGDGASGGTRLSFGSVVVPSRSSADAPPRMGWVFTALLGFHKLYSRLLLQSARVRLLR